MLYLKEAFYGLAIGFAVSMLLYGLEAAGAMVDNQRGASIARVLIPQLGGQGSISGSFLFQLAIVIFLTVGGHRLFFNSFFNSFVKLPVLEFPKAAITQSIVAMVEALSSGHAPSAEEAEKKSGLGRLLNLLSSGNGK